MKIDQHIVIGNAKFSFNVPISAFQNEVRALVGENWKEHYKLKDYNGNWNILSLRSPDGESDNILADLTYQDSFKDTSFMDKCLSIKAFIQSFNCEIKAVRLMNLTVGAIIKEHTDGDLAFEKGECRMHVPIFTNPNVKFIINGERVIMDEGTCWYINANLKHSVANNGATDRIHLVFDCIVNDWLKNAMELSAKTMVEQIPDTKNWLQTIDALKKMNTTDARQLAANMESQLADFKARGIIL